MTVEILGDENQLLYILAFKTFELDVVALISGVRGLQYLITVLCDFCKPQFPHL